MKSLLLFILSLTIGYMIGYLKGYMEKPVLEQQRQVWLDTRCNIHINKGIKYFQEECRSKK
jgi:hypothetical protein